MKSLAAEFHRVHGKARPILGTCMYGLAASMAAVGFQLAINWLYSHIFNSACQMAPTENLSRG
ncbi:MAG: hypothetical protein ACREIW_08615 [Chthoniobacterales bacterium]